MRILFLTQLWPWPLDAGAKVRAYHVLQHLAAAGHKITLASLVRDEEARQDAGPVRSLCEEVLTVPLRRSPGRDVFHLLGSLWGGEPFLIRRDRAPEMTVGLRRLAERGYDAIHADQLWMAPYALAAAQSAPRRPCLVLDCHNAVFELPRRMANHEPGRIRRALLARESRRLAAFETRLCAAFDRVAWVSARDRARLEEEGLPACAGRDRVIPIAVDPREIPFSERARDARRVTFVGGLHWPPNSAGVLWFVRRIWPRIRAAAPDAILTIIGKRPPPALAGGDPAVEVTGYLQDPAPILRETAAFIVPLRAASGMRVKILDAWCSGAPVVSTTVGAEGVDVREGENLLLADREAPFADAVLRLLDDRRGLGRKLAAGGRATVVAQYDWRTSYRAWDRIYS